MSPLSGCWTTNLRKVPTADCNISSPAIAPLGQFDTPNESRRDYASREKVVSSRGLLSRRCEGLSVIPAELENPILKLGVNFNSGVGMTKAQALMEARTRWGKNAVVRYNKGAFREGDRKQASADLKEHRTHKPVVPPTGRDAAYVQAFREWKAEEEKLFWIVMREPCDVGTLDNIANVFTAFHIHGSGDTWEQAFAKADRR